MDYIPQFKPWLDEAEARMLAKTIQDNWITGGKKVKEFEEKIAELCGVKYAVSCMNGTVALFMALKAMGIGERDEVIVPDFTFIASANSVVMAGATPVFVDVCRDTLNLAVEKIEDAITPRTKAIMPVHIYGQAAEMDGIMRIAEEHNLAVIEDAAQGIGVSYNGKPVGSFGNVGCLSFYADKTITTGEGGMILTDYEEIAKSCLRLGHQGNLSKGTYIHESIGYNFRMTDMQAAVGLAQLSKLKAIVKMKRETSSLYRELLGSIKGVSFPRIVSENETVPFRHIVFVPEPKELIKYLDSVGVGAKRVFYPLHRQPCYKGKDLDLISEWVKHTYSNPHEEFLHEDFDNSTWAYEHGIALPSSARLSEEEVWYICYRIKEFYETR